MRKIKDLKNQRFGRLIVLSLHSLIPKRGAYWLCCCDCGNQKIIRSSSLVRNSSQSCGCLQRETVSKINWKYGETSNTTRSAEYRAWCNMKNRCYNPNFIQHEDYAGRGIKICDRWLESFEHFLADVGLRPSPKHSLHRINNDGDYSSENCKWATIQEHRATEARLQYFSDEQIKQEYNKRFGTKYSK
jgi:hypothetical protein